MAKLAMAAVTELLASRSISSLLSLKSACLSAGGFLSISDVSHQSHPALPLSLRNEIISVSIFACRRRPSVRPSAEWSGVPMTSFATNSWDDGRELKARIWAGPPRSPQSQSSRARHPYVAVGGFSVG